MCSTYSNCVGLQLNNNMVCGVRYTESRRLNFPVIEQWYYVMHISSFSNKIKVELDF